MEEELNSQASHSSDLSRAEESRDDSMVTDEVKCGGNSLVGLIILCCFGSFTIGYSLTIWSQLFSYSIESSPLHEKGEFDMSIHSSMVPFGGCIGSLFIGSRFSSSSRRANLLIADVFAIIGFILALISTPTIKIVGLFLIGLSVGINIVVIPMYLIEYAPWKWGNGRVLAVHQFFIVLGMSTSYAWGLLLDNKSFREDDRSVEANEPYPVMICVLLPLLLVVVRTIGLICVFTRDTPSYYLLKNDRIHCLRVARVFYSQSEAMKLVELFSVKRAREIEGSRRLIDLFSARYVRRSCIAILLKVSCYFSGVFMILLYSRESLDMIQYNSNNEIRTFCVGLAMLCGFILYTFLTKSSRVSRKSLLLGGLGCNLLGFAILAVVLLFLSHESSVGLLDAIALFQALAAIGFVIQSSISHILVCEILPERGVAAASFVSLLSITVGAIIYPYIISSSGNQSMFYAGSAVICAAAFALNYKFIHETSGLSQYEIERVYTSSNSKLWI